SFLSIRHNRGLHFAKPLFRSFPAILPGGAFHGPQAFDFEAERYERGGVGRVLGGQREPVERGQVVRQEHDDLPLLV
ncbi:MAG TPA: hypothetical protein VFT99_12630, partial [Roseiflexaceae bacterium]|nr:hypothetical protein [Roseiflexaceae bacterium]